MNKGTAIISLQLRLLKTMPEIRHVWSTSIDKIYETDNIDNSYSQKSCEYWFLSIDR